MPAAASLTATQLEECGPPTNCVLPATVTSANGGVQQRVHAATGMILPHWVAVQFVLAGEHAGCGATMCAFRAGRWPGVQQKEQVAVGVTQPHWLAANFGLAD